MSYRGALTRSWGTCEACAKPLSPGQARFCSDMCRVTFAEVFAAPFDVEHEFGSEDDVLTAEEVEEARLDAEHRRSIQAFDEDLGTNEDDEELGDLDDDFDDDDLDDLGGEDDLRGQSDFGDDEDFEDEGDFDEDSPLLPPNRTIVAASSYPAAVASPPSASPAAHSSSTGALQLLPWEAVPEMEAHVGIHVARATCRIAGSVGGGVTLDITTELRRAPTPPVLSGDPYLRLVAVAEDAAGEFVAWVMTNIPKRSELPPLCVENLTVRAPVPVARLRLYPEVN